MAFQQIWCPNPAGLYAAAIILLFFSTLTVGLRVAARRLRKAGLGADDYTIAFGLVLTWVTGVLTIVGTARGDLGVHTEANPKTGQIIPSTVESQASMYANVAQIFTVLADGIIKCSLLLMYRRIFIGQTFSRVSLALLGLMAIWTVAFFLATVLECGSYVSASWSGPAIDHKYCKAIAAIWLGHAISDLITDLMVLAVPIPIVAQLNMERTNKIALLAIFTLGLFSTGAATARLVYVARDQYETTLGARDVSAIKTNILVWGYIESAIGIITSCLVTMRPLLRNRTAESIVHSLRSVVSLSSLDCHAQKENDTDNENLTARLPSTSTHGSVPNPTEADGGGQREVQYELGQGGLQEEKSKK